MPSNEVDRALEAVDGLVCDNPAQVVGAGYARVLAAELRRLHKQVQAQADSSAEVIKDLEARLNYGASENAQLRTSLSEAEKRSLDDGEASRLMREANVRLRERAEVAEKRADAQKCCPCHNDPYCIEAPDNVWKQLKEAEKRAKEQDERIKELSGTYLPGSWHDDMVKEGQRILNGEGTWLGIKRETLQYLVAHAMSNAGSLQRVGKAESEVSELRGQVQRYEAEIGIAGSPPPQGSFIQLLQAAEASEKRLREAARLNCLYCAEGKLQRGHNDFDAPIHYGFSAVDDNKPCFNSDILAVALAADETRKPQLADSWGTESDPIVTCGSCKKTLRVDPMDRTCRLCHGLLSGAGQEDGS